MDREELIRALDENFQLTHWQDDQKDGRGYRLNLKASWNFANLDVHSIHVQLVGTNPLTGENIEPENIVAVFSFDQKEFQIKRKLNYHGKFCLRCTAVRGTGEQLTFRNQKIMLECPESKPRIHYSVKETQGFLMIEIRSNCWENCRGKLWITVDGHDQCVNVPAGHDNVVRCYMRGAGNLERIRVQDSNVILRQER